MSKQSTPKRPGKKSPHRPTVESPNIIPKNPLRIPKNPLHTPKSPLRTPKTPDVTTGGKRSRSASMRMRKTKRH